MKLINLEEEYSKMESILDSMKSRANEMSKRVVLSKGPYFEFPMFSYQRSRMQQGRLIKNINRLKSYDDVYRYTFDDSERLIRKEWGNRLGQFWNTFYIYGKGGFLYLSYTYNAHDHPANVTSYKFASGKLSSLDSYGMYGTRSEDYIYVDGILKRIDISSRSHDDEGLSNISELFYYDSAGDLNKIEVEYKFGGVKTIYAKKVRKG